MPATKRYPKRTGRNGFVDPRACERLGLGAQWKQVILDQHEDGGLICLSGAGELLIHPAGAERACVLDFQMTAKLIIFMQGDNTQKLFPAILRAALLAQGGKVARVMEKLDAILAQHTAAPVEETPA